MKCLVINAGSSSHKLSFYDITREDPIAPIWQGTIEWKKKGKSLLTAKTLQDVQFKKELNSHDVKKGLTQLIETLWQGETQVIANAHQIDCVGHRVVHGGPHFEEPVQVNQQVKEEIKKWGEFAPLHNPASLEGIAYIESTYPLLPQLICFDTAFHATMPEKIKTYPIPLEWREHGIQRYGFHGISHQYCAERLAKLVKPNLKMINCHLGNGCSLCAIQEGKSWETTMGLTPLEGVMMGTRSGSIDPSIPLYLIEKLHLSPHDILNSLNLDSGLQGISGISDMRDLLSQQTASSQLALDMFIHRLKTAIGALTVSLEGVDILSFTGGIGENSEWVRSQICKGLNCLGIVLNERKNKQCLEDQEITDESSKVKIWVIHTQEDWMIAKSCLNYKFN
jgi:acetate kinase